MRHAIRSPLTQGATMSTDPQVTDELLEILRCPETFSKLDRADDATVEKLNRSIAAGQLTNHAGEVIKQPLRGALVNQPPTLLYPVYDHGVTLLVDEAIPIERINSASNEANP